MNANDVLYSPIIPADRLRELVKKLLTNPTDPDLLDQISNDIVDLFMQYGIDDEQEIIDAVYRTKKELDGYLFMIKCPAGPPGLGKGDQRGGLVIGTRGSLCPPGEGVS